MLVGFQGDISDARVAVDKTAAALETANEAEMLDVRVYYELALVCLRVAELNLATCQFRIIKLRDKLGDHPTCEEWRAANVAMMQADAAYAHACQDCDNARVARAAAAGAAGAAGGAASASAT